MPRTHGPSRRLPGGDSRGSAPHAANLPQPQPRRPLPPSPPSAAAASGRTAQLVPRVPRPRPPSGARSAVRRRASCWCVAGLLPLSSPPLGSRPLFRPANPRSGFGRGRLLRRRRWLGAGVGGLAAAAASLSPPAAVLPSPSPAAARPWFLA
jgi:hypothetical protein